jgi:predicted metal-dependent hydrolase
VSKKSGHIATLVERFRGGDLDARYLAYFDCFNRQLFFEAHEVLEDLWLTNRNGPDGAFYKGLIQLAGAFVHVQKKRSSPAAALLGLARDNLRKYPNVHQKLEIKVVLALIENSLVWLIRSQPGSDLRAPGKVPFLSLCES